MPENTNSITQTRWVNSNIKKKNPELGNSNPKGHTCYVFTNKWILAKKVENTYNAIHRTKEG